MRIERNMLSRILGLAWLALMLSSCASTKMTSSWRLPETGPLEFEKVMALVLVQDASVRRVGEDELVRQIQRAEAIPSYRLVEEQDLKDEAKLREAVESSGVDAVVVLRPVYDENEITYNSGSYPGPYYSFYGYYGWGYGISYAPGYYQQDRLVGVETNVYDVKSGKLVWSGLSQTTNPEGVRKLVADTAKAVRNEMRKYGFLK